MMFLSRAKQMFVSRLQRSIPYWAYDVKSAWKKYGMYNWSLSDPLIRSFFFNKFYQHWYAYPPFYNHWFSSFFAVGVVTAVSLRHVFFNPEYMVSRAEGRRLPADRLETYYYSLPYFNHHMRNFSSCFRNSFVDNEPDYLSYHPWGIYPQRTNSVKRLKAVWSLPWYFVDVANYDKTLHVNMQKHYEDLGYCKPLFPSLSDKAEEDEE